MCVNTEFTQESASYNNLTVTKEAHGERVNIFANNKNDANTCSTRRSKLFTISSDNLASNINVSISKPQNSQFNFAQSPQASLAAASHNQSDIKNNLMPRHHHRKRLRTPALMGPTSITSTVSGAFKSNNSEHN